MKIKEVKSVAEIKSLLESGKKIFIEANGDSKFFNDLENLIASYITKYDDAFTVVSLMTAYIIELARKELKNSTVNAEIINNFINTAKQLGQTATKISNLKII